MPATSSFYAPIVIIAPCRIATRREAGLFLVHTRKWAFLSDLHGLFEKTSTQRPFGLPGTRLLPPPSGPEVGQRPHEVERGSKHPFGTPILQAGWGVGDCSHGLGASSFLGREEFGPGNGLHFIVPHDVLPLVWNEQASHLDEDWPPLDQKERFALMTRSDDYLAEVAPAESKDLAVQWWVSPRPPGT